MQQGHSISDLNIYIIHKLYINYTKKYVYMYTAVFSMDLAEPNYEKPQSINRTNL